MAYQGNNNKGKNNRPNYFEQLKNQNGGLDSKSIYDLEYDALKIFKEINRGWIDPTLYHEYFSNTQLMGCMLKVANDNHNKYNFIVNSITANMMVNPNLNSDNYALAILDEHKRLAAAYLIILQMLNAFVSTGDTFHMVPFIGKLNQLRVRL